MEMTGERRIAVPRTVVWDALNDPEVLKAAIPGCDSVEREGEDRFKATVAMRIGPMAIRFGGKVRLENLEPPGRYSIRGEGSGGAMGFAKGTADVLLSEDGPDATRLAYVARAQVGGKMAQLGARLIDSTAKQVSDQFFTSLAAKLEASHPPRAATPAEVAPAVPGAEPTMGRGGIPRPLIYAAAAAVLALLAYALL